MEKYNLPESPDKKDLIFDQANIRASVGQNNGEARVREYHGKHYDASFGGRVDTCKEALKQLDKEAQHEDTLLKNRRKVLSNTNSTLPNTEDEISQPWNLMAMSTVAILFLASIALLGVSFGTIYSNLMATGEAVFIENPWIAGLFGFVPMAVSFSLKVVVDHFKTDRAKRIAIYLIFTFGILFGVIWISLFAYLFNGMGQSVSDIVNDLVTSENAMESLLEKAYVAVQLVTEVLVAAGFWLIIKHIYDLHHQVPPKVNPEYSSLEKEIKKSEAVLVDLNNRRSVVQHRLAELINQRAVYIDDAVTEFHLRESQYGMKHSSMKVITNPKFTGKGEEGLV